MEVPSSRSAASYTAKPRVFEFMIKLGLIM